MKKRRLVPAEGWGGGIALSLLLFLLINACSSEPEEPCIAGTPGCADADADGDADSDADVDTGPLVFNPPSGTFVESVDVAISREDGTGGEIRYTLDGSIPGPSSLLYDGTPIAITQTTEIQAELFENGESLGTAVAVYIPRTADVSINLPIVVIDNQGGGEPDREYVHSLFMVFETHDEVASLSNPADTAVRSAFHLRGQSSAEFDKKPYRVELRDRNDEDKDYSVLGMPSESDWVLRGPYVDRSLIRDAFHYGLGPDMGLAAPRFAFCEFYKNLDGDALEPEDYEGVYMVVETIKNQKYRQDLKQLEPEDTTLPEISGGYIFKFEWMAAEEPLIECPGIENCWGDLEAHDPDDINREQEAWLADYLYSFTTALHSENFTDPTVGYTAYVDTASFVNHIIINELGREFDSYVRSAFFYKDRDDVIFAGPLWDYNLTLGVGMSTMWDNISTEGWTYDAAFEREPSDDWFLRMLDDPAFVTQLKERWRTLRTGVLSDAALLARIDALAAPLTEGAARNFERWPDLLGTSSGGDVWGGDGISDMFEYTATQTWAEQIDVLKQWLLARTAWLDSQWN